jgi:hypothetical protein
VVVISLSPDKFQPECFRVCFSPYRSGEFCQCDAQQFSDIDTDKCKSANETGALVCSGNGECDCGVCRCNLIPVSYIVEPSYIQGTVQLWSQSIHCIWLFTACVFIEKPLMCMHEEDVAVATFSTLPLCRETGRFEDRLAWHLFKGKN